MTPEDFMQLRPDTPGYVNYTEAGRSAAEANRPKRFNANKTFRSVKAASGLGLRELASNASTSRMALPVADTAKSGVQSFSPSTPKKKDEFNINELNSLGQLELGLGRKRLDTELEYSKKMGDQTIDFNVNKLNRYDKIANNEANRALGMELSTRLPYAAFEKSAGLFKGAETLSSSLPGVLDTLKYQKNVSMSL